MRLLTSYKTTRSADNALHASNKKMLSYALALSMMLLVASLYPAFRHLIVDQGGHAVIRSVFADGSDAAPLIVPMIAYAAAIITLHMLVGAVVLLLTYLTRMAFPATKASRQSILLLWFLAISCALVLTSAAMYPRSHAGGYWYELAIFSIGPVRAFELFWLLLGLVFATIIARIALAARMMLLVRKRALLSSVAGAVVCMLGASVWLSSGNASISTPAIMAQPHVVVIGLDSLRTDLLARFGGEGHVPHLDSALTDAYLFKDAVSPLARTFPAWVSILTGKHPRTTGAWFNLTPHDLIQATPTLADSLKSSGYETVYATDEVRFANFDESYGFDKVLTPRIGATDFVLGTINDLPVVNLIVNTRLGERLFPNTYANRAVANRYMPNVFLDKLRRNVAFDKPTLFIVHLTAGHWPYHDASKDGSKLSSEFKEAKYQRYLYGIQTADSQVRDILSWLREKRVLENAVVWFLSDHGEAFGQPSDRLIPGMSSGSSVSLSAHGHGTSVLSPTQYQVLLAVKGYGVSRALVSKGETDLPASLEDLTPTTLDLVRPAVQCSACDGMSLKSIVQGSLQDTSALRARIRFTETDFNLPRMLAGDINPAWLAMQSAEYYQVDPVSGWVELKPEKLPGLMILKERAAIQGNAILAALPTTEKKSLYVAANRRDGTYTILGGRPEGTAGIAHQVLWDALHARFSGELGEPKIPESEHLTQEKADLNMTSSVPPRGASKRHPSSDQGSRH